MHHKGEGLGASINFFWSMTATMACVTEVYVFRLDLRMLVVVVLVLVLVFVVLFGFFLVKCRC